MVEERIKSNKMILEKYFANFDDSWLILNKSGG